MKILIRFFLFSYIFFVSWTEVLALSDWLLLPFVFLFASVVLIFFLLLIKLKIPLLVYSNIDYFLIFFFLIFSISGIVNNNELFVNYLLAYFFLIFFVYFFLKGALYKFISIREIYIANLAAVIFVCTFICVNFILSLNGFNFQEFLPRDKPANAIYMGRYIRGYGFSSEPGIVAFYINTLGPLAVWFLIFKTNFSFFFKFIFSFIITAGLFLTFSAAGIFFILVSINLTLIIIFFKKIKNKFRLKKFLKTGVFVVSFIFLISIIFQFSSVNKITSPLISKIKLSENNRSVRDRLNRWEASTELIFKKPLLGFGPRYFTSNKVGDTTMSSLNWYFMILIESGFISFIFIMLFLFSVLIKIINLNHQSNIAYLIGFLAGAGHLLVISTFFYPFLFLLIAIFFVQKASLKINDC